MNGILMVMAHPDDEVIFGFPVLQDLAIPIEILLCSNQNRHWPNIGAGGRAAAKLWKDMGVPITCLNHDTDFYCQPGHAEFCHNVMYAISQRRQDTIFTHNPLGEYGHPDHKLIFEIVSQAPDRRVIFSDIWRRRGWTPWLGVGELAKRAWLRNLLGPCKLKMDWYQKCRQYYEDAGAWTWNGGAIEECNLYYL